MVVDIPAPDHESRVAIIKSKCASMNLFIDDNIIDYLADSIRGNIRDLEGVINLIICQKSKLQDWYEHFKTYYPEYNTW